MFRLRSLTTVMSKIKNLPDHIFQRTFNPVFHLPIGDNPPEEVNMMVENPMGSINKYEYNTETGLLKLDRVLYERLPYPVEYGAIPQTWDPDQDPLDVMCLVTTPTFPGCIISVRPIGVMLFDDCGEVDNKILAVPADDIRFSNIRDLTDVTRHQIEEITFFMEHYKDLQLKYKGQPELKVQVKGWEDKSVAYRLIKEAAELFKSKFGADGQRRGTEST